MNGKFNAINIFKNLKVQENRKSMYTKKIHVYNGTYIHGDFLNMVILILVSEQSDEFIGFTIIYFF